MELRRKNKYLKDYDMPGREKTIKTPKILKIVETILAMVQEVCLPDSLIYAFTL